MRSGSSDSRYCASRSCACLSGPPVNLTSAIGNGRAFCATTGAAGPPACTNTNPPAKSASNAMTNEIRFT